MGAVDELDDPLTERPTIPVPVPHESGIQLKVARVALTGATVDVVVCDLSRDPRSEDYRADGGCPPTARSPRLVLVPQNESPPSTSIVRALK